MKKRNLLVFSLTLAMGSGVFPYVVHAETSARPVGGTTAGQPFLPGTGGSQKFRIPCLVTLDDGTIVAAADARWNGGGDAGGIDTMVSRSKDLGESWEYSFANYLGDNGDTFNVNSTAFIDPAIATDGDSLYMIADLYPAGYAINTAPHRPAYHFVGQNEKGELLLAKVGDDWTDCWDRKREDKNSYTYALHEKTNGTHEDRYEIVDNASGTVVSGYTIDGLYNIKGNGVDTNLFMSESPFQVWPNDYLYFTRSDDKGETWSDPMLLNMRQADEQALLVGPGRGTVTDDGKLIFTSYEWTGGDRNSSLLISEDEGKTWKRGGDTPSQTSESVMCEADGRYYLFTRHGGYFVSEDEGMTWSQKKDMGITYNLNCQLTAVTYPEKIDGRTAIVFAAPSSTSSRSAGKIFVGLVQDDGSLQWKYEHSVNGDAYYAYSCLTVLPNGNLGLLYEDGGTSIRYTSIAIDDVVSGVIGDLWCSDETGAVKTVALASGETKELMVNGLGEGETKVTSSDPAVTAVLHGNTLSLQAGDVAGLKQVTVTLENNDHTCTLLVNVSDSKQYRIVNLKVGDMKTIVDETGNYADADVSGIDRTVADVEVSGEDAPLQDVSTAVLKSKDKVFEGKEESLAKQEFIFRKTAADTYTIQATVGNENVYMNHKGASAPGIVCTKKETNIKLVQTGEDVYFEDLSGGTAGKYLYFHRDDKGGKQFRYDRNSTTAPECAFALYVKDDNAKNSGIIGYRKLTSMKEIVDGGSYLIAAEAAGSRYVLHPSLSTAPYDHVAKVVDHHVSAKGGLAAAIGDDKNFAQGKIALNDCLFTFAKNGENYHVYSDVNGKRAYLSFRTSAHADRPLTEQPGEIKLTADGDKVVIEQVNGTNGKYLYFWNNGNNAFRFDRNSGISNETKFALYEPAQGENNSGIKGYRKVTVANVKDGGRYLIAAHVGDSDYVLHPNLSGNAWNYAAKVLNEEYEPETSGARTTITFTGVMNGSTSVKIGTTDYFICVQNDVKRVSLQKGETYTFPGEILALSGEEGALTMTKNDEMAPYTAVSEVVDGKYVIGNGAHIITMQAVADETDARTKGLRMMNADLSKGDLRDALFTVTKKEDGKYTLQSPDGKYVNFTADHSVELLAKEARVELVKKNNGFAVKAGGNYLNDYRGFGALAATWTSDDNTWSLYAPSKGQTVTATAPGTVTYVTKGTDHVVTVIADAKPVHKLNVVYDPTMGKVVQDPEGSSFEEGAQVTLQAVANDGYRFTGWDVNGTVYDRDVLTVSVDKDLEVKAEFAKVAEPTPTDKPHSSAKPEVTATPQSSANPAVTPTPQSTNRPEVVPDNDKPHRPATGDARRALPWTCVLVCAAVAGIVMRKK